MNRPFSYTETARKFAIAFPKLSYILIQINFWILANNLMGLVIHYHSEMLATSYGLEAHSRLGPIVLLATNLGIFYGLVPGLIFYQLDKRLFKNYSIGKIFVIKFFITAFVGASAFVTLTFLADALEIPLLMPGRILSSANAQVWNYTLLVSMLYYLIMSLLLGFINFNNHRYGPGVLLPMLLGKYRSPIVETRIFIFMDLQSSTATAEQIGHLKYSAFIRDCFLDIDQAISGHAAEIYQYAGDEIIVSWKVASENNNPLCLEFFFACQQIFIDKASRYARHYGVVPTFKAGIHMGTVTAVEVGDIKREIAFHGDAINSTARIQGLCNAYKKPLLISQEALSSMIIPKSYHVEDIGLVQLKGKVQPNNLYSISIKHLNSF